MAVVDALRRVPIVSHPLLGTYSLRHLELATRQLAPGESDTNVPTPEEIEAALKSAPLEDEQRCRVCVQAAIRAIGNITSMMQAHNGAEACPDFAPLLAPLTRIDRLLGEHVARRSNGAAAGAMAMDAPAEAEAEEMNTDAAAAV